MQGSRSECGKFKANKPGGQHVKNKSLNPSPGAVISSPGSPGCRQAPAPVSDEQPRSPRDAAPDPAAHLGDTSLGGGQRVVRAAAPKLRGFGVKLGWAWLRSGSEPWNHRHGEARRAWAVDTEGEGGDASAGVLGLFFTNNDPPPVCWFRERQEGRGRALYPAGYPTEHP